jgi:hypothetical protein
MTGVAISAVTDRTAPQVALQPGAVLPVARYRFTFRMADDLLLPEFAGSLLRGQFGAALRRTACMTGARECPPCPLYRTCPYPAIFATPPPAAHSLQRFSEVPNPYVIEPPPLATRHVAAGDSLSFEIVLVGRALDQLPLIAHAMQRAFAHGIGRRRARGELEDLALQAADGPRSVWDCEQSRIEAHEAVASIPPLPRVEAVTLRIATPLRLQRQGHAIAPAGLQPRALFTALLRRISLLLELHAGRAGLAGDAGRLAAAASRLQDEKRLAWKDWTRFSSRQQQEMTLGGVIGEWTLRGQLDDLLPWFWLGQWLHVGKNATMGMGRYSLSW